MRGESIRPPINFSKDRFAFFFSFFLLTFYQRLPQIKLNSCGNAAGTGALDVTPERDPPSRFAGAIKRL
jgi:hypothetical protein